MDKDILIRSMYEGYIFLHFKENEKQNWKKGNPTHLFANSSGPKKIF